MSERYIGFQCKKKYGLLFLAVRAPVDKESDPLREEFAKTEEKEEEKKIIIKKKRIIRNENAKEIMSDGR